MGLFYEKCILLGIIGKKSVSNVCQWQPHWFAGTQLDISKFPIFNNFHNNGPICMKGTKQFGFRNTFILVTVLLFPILFL